MEFFLTMIKHNQGKNWEMAVSFLILEMNAKFQDVRNVIFQSLLMLLKLLEISNTCIQGKNHTSYFHMI